MTTQKTIRIDVVSDIVCPWCIIGYKRLEKALTLVDTQLTAEIHWHPFVLNTHLTDEGTNYKVHIQHKYGRTPEQVDEIRGNLTQIGAELGFTFDYFEEMQTYSSMKAHQLVRFARDYDKETDMKLRLMTAFFGERKNIADPETLVHEATAVGLPAEKVRSMLATNQLQTAVQEEINLWQQMGINSVPSYIINNSYVIPGAQEPQTLAEALIQISNETPVT